MGLDQNVEARVDFVQQWRQHGVRTQKTQVLKCFDSVVEMRFAEYGGQHNVLQTIDKTSHIFVADQISRHDRFAADQFKLF